MDDNRYGESSWSPDGDSGGYYGAQPNYPYSNVYPGTNYNYQPKKSHTGLIVGLCVGVPVLIIILTTVCGAVIGSLTDSYDYSDDPASWRTSQHSDSDEPNADDSGSDANDSSNTGADSGQSDLSTSGSDDVANVNDPDDIEAKVRATPNDPDSNGDYTSAAEAVVRSAGMQLNWGLSDARRYCRLGSGARNSVVAGYCEQTPHIVYVNTKLYEDIQYDPYLVHAMRHEIAHHVIDLRCGTAEPRIASTSYEAVTSSYAVLYLGASRRVLSETDSTGANSYRMTVRTDEIARRIHAGQCE